MVYIGCNIHGNINEINIVKNLNNFLYKNLNNNLKEFIKYICLKESILLNENTLIKSGLLNNQSKGDIYIKINNKIFYISIKSGQGNSFHQEKCDTFIKYIKEELNADNKICEDINWFISSTEKSYNLKRKHPERIKNINDFLYDNKTVLITRFIKGGISNKNNADYLYYGNEISGQWRKIEEIIYNIQKINTKSALNIGYFSIQAWNRSNLKRKGFIQVKCSNIKNILNK